MNAHNSYHVAAICLEALPANKKTSKIVLAAPFTDWAEKLKGIVLPHGIIMPRFPLLLPLGSQFELFLFELPARKYDAGSFCLLPGEPFRSWRIWKLKICIQRDRDLTCRSGHKFLCYVNLIWYDCTSGSLCNASFV